MNFVAFSKKICAWTIAGVLAMSGCNNYSLRNLLRRRHIVYETGHCLITRMAVRANNANFWIKRKMLF